MTRRRRQTTNWTNAKKRTGATRTTPHRLWSIREKDQTPTVPSRRKPCWESGSAMSPSGNTRPRQFGPVMSPSGNTRPRDHDASPDPAASTSLFVDLSGPPWHPSHRLDRRILWTPQVSICVCWPPKRRVYNITSSSLLHRNSPTSLLPAQSIAVSASADRHSLCPHCQGYLPAYP